MTLVLRDGRVVVEAPVEEMPKERVVRAMVGDAAPAGQGTQTGRRRDGIGARGAGAGGARPANRWRGFWDQPAGPAAGECVGLAGLAGSGKSEIGDAIAGLVAPIEGTDLGQRRGPCAAAM